MNTVISRDGTAIAYERVGDGPAVILVDGALCHRASGPARPLAARLAERFTVYAYDRRGRGDSGDNQPYAIQREIDDIAALIDDAGGQAFVFGGSNISHVTEMRSPTAFASSGCASSSSLLMSTTRMLNSCRRPNASS